MISLRRAPLVALLGLLTLGAVGLSTPSLAAGLGQKNAAVTGSWKDFPVDGGAFTIKFPSKPTCEDQNAGDGLVVHICTYDAGNLALLVSVTKLPGKVTKSNFNRALDGGVKGSIDSLEGVLTDSQDIAISGQKGRDFAGKSDQYKFKSRMFLSGNSLVQAIGIRENAAPASYDAKIEAFVSSLLPKGGQ